jgi:hypothetical protein
MEDYDHALSVRKAFRQDRTCHRTTCLRKVRLVVNCFPLCVKHATEEFTEMLREYGVRP